jgi:hypothetical protein
MYHPKYVVQIKCRRLSGSLLMEVKEKEVSSPLKKKNNEHSKLFN